MAKNYGPTRSSWPNEPCIPLTMDMNDQWIEGREPVAMRLLSPLQQDPVALLAATQVNNCSKGEFVKRLTQAVGDN